MACPSCGERIPAFAAQCRHCQEFLLPAARARELAELRASLLLGLLGGCGLLLLLFVVAGVTAAAAHPALAQMRRRWNEREAVASLRAVAAAQTRLREGGGEGETTHEYGDMTALARAQLLERELATGIKDGYKFTVAACDLAPAERWLAIAEPKEPGQSGGRHFAVNHTGAIYSLGRPFPLDTQRCELPPDAVPLGEGEWE